MDTSMLFAGLLVLMVMFSFLPIAFVLWFCVGLILVVLVKSPTIGARHWARHPPRSRRIRTAVPPLLEPYEGSWTVHHEIPHAANLPPINPHLSSQIQQLLRREIYPEGESSQGAWEPINLTTSRRIIEIAA
jgi:hypothetical protein